jgi:hypothetical protein
MEKEIAFRTIMNAPNRDHPHEDALERFLLGQSEEEELEIVETHLMVCEACVTRLETLEFEIAATKVALQIMRAEEAKQLEQVLAKGWKSWFTPPRLSWIGAAMAACAILITVAAAPHEVTLAAYRGTESISVVEWRPLQMHLKAIDIASGPVGIELVDSRGAKIWQGHAAAKNDNIDVRVPPFTTDGTYYLRIYSTASGELQREFSLQAKPLF